MENNNKKKQTAVVAVATALSVGSIMNPVYINAQEIEPASHDAAQGNQEPSDTKLVAPALVLPEGLSASEGQSLAEIKLPEDWHWVDETIKLSKDTATYLAKYDVDDMTYDYSKVEGYQSEDHTVERELTVTVLAKKMMKSTATTSISDITIDATHFPDEYFRTLVTNSYDKNPKDGVLSVAEIEAATGNLTNHWEAFPIKSIAGIEYLPYITTLDMSYTGIESADISKNLKLTSLSFYETKLTALNTQANTALTDISIGNTRITSLDLRTNTALERIFANKSDLVSLDLSHNPEMIELDIKNTKMHALDVHTNTKLSLLSISGAPLAYLNLGNNTSVTLDTTNSSFNLDVGKDSFDLTKMFPDIDVSKISNVNGAKLDGNMISDFSHKTPFTYTYDCGGNKQLNVSITLSGLFIDSVNFPDPVMKDFADSNDSDGDGYLSTSELSNVKMVRIYDKPDLANIKGIEYFTNLTDLGVTSPKIKSIDASKIPLLYNLDVNNTGITNLDVSHNPNLFQLCISNTKIRGIDVSNNPDFQWLDNSNASLTWLNIGTNSHEVSLRETTSQLTLDVTGNIDMTKEFPGIDVSKIKNLKGAKRNGNIMSEIDKNIPITYDYDCGTDANGPVTLHVELTVNFQGIAINETNFPDEMFREYISDNFDADSNGILSDDEINKITEINTEAYPIVNIKGIEFFPQLSNLVCTNISGSEIDVSKNTNITTLSTYASSVSTIKGLDKLTKLESLDVSETPMETLDVSKHKALKELSINDTKIKGIDISHNTNLTTFTTNQGMVWLKAGKNNHLDLNDFATSANVAAGEYFDITKKFPGIDVKDISNLKGATLEGNVLKDYTKGVPITYTYDCGIGKNGPIYLSVTLTIGEVEINEENFPDPVFRQWVKDYYDTDNNGTLSDVEIGNVVDGPDDSNIKSIKGIEFFYNLSYMWLDSVPLTELDISSNKKLTSFQLMRMPAIKDIDISENKLLSFLELSYTSITEIDLSQHSELKTFSNNGSTLHSLDVSHNKKLADLYLSDAVNMNDYNYPMNMAWLNIGVNPNLNVEIRARDPRKPYHNIIDIQAGSSFDITQRYPGIDTSKITIISGGTLSGDIVSGYQKDVPIKYTYDCGIGKNGPVTLDVTMNVSDVEINEKNFPDAVFRQYVKDTFDLDHSDTLSDVELDNITVLKLPTDISNRITSLKGIEFFVSLEEFECNNSQIKDLDVSKNPNLTILRCNSNGLTSIDLSQNVLLKEISLNNTQITGLDLEYNLDVTTLSLTDTPILWLKFYDRSGMKLQKTNTVSSITVYGESFNITEVIPGINPDYVSITSGGSIQGEIVTLDNAKTLSYSYLCGTIDGTEITHNVTLDLITKKDVSTVEMVVDSIGDSVYTGKKVENPEVTNSGSTNPVTYIWEKQNGTSWDLLTEAPKDVGTYRVTAHVEADDFYRAGSSEPVEFSITKNPNKWTTLLTIQDWTYGETANKPSAKSEFGDVTFSYSNSAQGTFSKEPPTDAGTWYVKAEVKGTDNYDGLSTIVGFDINQAKSTITVDDLNSVYTGQPIKPSYTIIGSTKTPRLMWGKKVNGTWNTITNPPTDAGQYRLRIVVTAEGNYAMTASEYFEFTISKAPNKWTTALNIQDWTYNETANEPKAVADFGSVTYTYSDAENGTYTSTKPTTSGTWYVKAEVAGTDNYTGITSTKSFTIEKAESTVKVTGDPSCVYTGNQAVEPTFEKTGSDGAHSYIWEEYDAGTWKALQAAPSDAGKYRVSVKVAANDNYKEAKSSPKEFTITKAPNGWKTALTMDDWVYGETASEPKAATNFGSVTYTYSDKADGNFVAEKPTSAGTWYVKATVSETSNYEGITNTIAFTISTATNAWIVEPSISDWTYGNIASTPSATAKHGKVTFTYSTSKSGTFTQQQPSNAGTYFMKTTVNASADYEGLEDVREFKITKADSKIAIKGNLNVDYTGKKVANPAYDTEGSTGDVQYQWEMKNSDGSFTVLQEAPILVGSYRVSATLAENDNYLGATSDPVAFTIAKATNAWTSEVAIANWTYGETASTPTATATFGTSTISYTYSDAENGTYTSTRPTNAGTWYVKAEVAGTDNYTGITSTKSFTIEKAESTVKVTGDPSCVYTGNQAVEPTFDKTGSDGAHSYIWEEYDAGTWKALQAAPSNAGKYRVSVKVAANNNYKEAKSSPKEFTITKAPNGWKTALSMEDWVYGETASEPKAVATFGTSTISYTYSDAENGTYTLTKPTNAGTWYVKAEVAGTDNYTGITSTKSFTIKKANSTIVIKNMSDLDYTGNKVKEPSVDISGSHGQISYIWEQEDSNGTWSIRKESPTKVGSYRVTATLAGNDNYHEATSTSVPFKILRAANDWTTALDIEDWTYGEKAKEPSASSKFGDVVYMYSDSQSGEFTKETPTTAGSWCVKAVVEGSDDYYGIVDYKAFTIHQATNAWTTTLDIEGWTYGEQAKEPSASSKYGDVVYTYSNSLTGTFTDQKPTNAGTWYVKAEVKETTNYKSIVSTKQFVIAKAKALPVVLPDNLSAIHDSELATITLPQGWSWVNDKEVISTQKTEYDARLSVDDENYDYSGVDGYDKVGHYVQRALNVMVAARENAWINEPTIEDWTYGESAKQPNAKASYGTIIYTYSDRENGVYTNQVPSDAGTWYMKAIVERSPQHTGLEKNVAFNIKKAIPNYQVPKDLSVVYGQTIHDISLPKNFTWEDHKKELGDVGTYTRYLTYTPDDVKNYEVVSNIEVSITVKKADNQFTSKLTLVGWTYHGVANTPKIQANFGTARFVYSKTSNGVFHEEVPSEAGTWYVKAIVDDCHNWNAIESETIAFTITPKDMSKEQGVISGVTSAKDLDQLKVLENDKVLKEGVDYDVVKVVEQKKVTVTIKFKGNYTGTITKEYPIADQGIDHMEQETTVTTSNQTMLNSSLSYADTSKTSQPSKKENAKDASSTKASTKDSQSKSKQADKNNIHLEWTAIPIVGGLVAIFTRIRYKRRKNK